MPTDRPPEGEIEVPCKPPAPMVRWGAVLAGAVGGLALFVFLMTTGVAVGAVPVSIGLLDPPLLPALWTTIAFAAGSFTAGYVSARMSGLRRRGDGMLHGFVAWAGTAVLSTLLIGSLLPGGDLPLLGTRSHPPALSAPADSRPAPAPAEPDSTDYVSDTFAAWAAGALAAGLLTALWGGSLGARTTAERTIGNHTDEREVRRAD